MNGLTGLLGTAADLLLVIVGFGLIVFLHELGHFAAAKWAGIRVLAFAMGFGPALVSWRKGLGIRFGSSEPEYNTLVKAGRGGSNSVLPSPTEYRLNWLPFGGYVKMLGQDDTNPAAVSDAPDSFQSCAVWKRMIVISAGVCMNVVTAAVLFMAVFLHGLETEPAKIGTVYPGKPASRARVVDGPADKPGLKPGDTVLSIDDHRAKSFNDLMMASAMSGRGEAIRLVVQRPGVAQSITFEVTPEESEVSRLREMGVEPARSVHLVNTKSDEELAIFRARVAEAGTPELEPGMRLTRINGAAVTSASELTEAIQRSGGEAVQAEFESAQGRRITVSIGARPSLQTGLVALPSGSRTPISHLLGLVPVLMVNTDSTGSKPAQGLKEGDIFARLGALEFPSLVDGVAEIKRHRGGSIEVDVLRSASGSLTRVAIKPDPQVRSEDGVIGFIRGESDAIGTWVALPPPAIIDAGDEARPPAAATLITRPGTRIVEVAGKPVRNFAEIRAALRTATAKSLGAPDPSCEVPVTLELPLANQQASPALEHATWRLSGADVAALHQLGWESKLGLDLFELEQAPLRAAGATFPARALDAVKMGVSETNRVMLTTYMTFARLFQGTVKIEHLKGPVGIAHLGTRVVERGFIWLLFFMALISINLAVVNFLPLPIVDGGQFVFLIIEQIRGRPVSVEIQGFATVAGLILIGAVFLIVTFHDIVNLFG